MKRVVYYKDQSGAWRARSYAAQCGTTMLPYNCRCQGAAGHAGDHWAYAPDGSLRLLYADLGVLAGCMASLAPGSPGYRAPAQMQAGNYTLHFEDSAVTDPTIVERILRDETLPGESVVLDLAYARELAPLAKAPGRADGG